MNTPLAAYDVAGDFSVYGTDLAEIVELANRLFVYTLSAYLIYLINFLRSVPLKKTILSAAAMFACVGLIAACQTTTEPAQTGKAKMASPTTLKFQIAADTVACTTGGFISDPVPTRCMIVNGERFSQNISGYNHQEGVGRVLKVERTQFCDPDVFNSCPQDTFNFYDYRLLSVIE